MVVGGGVVGVAATTADESRLAAWAAACTAAETAVLKLFDPVAADIAGDVGRGPRRSWKNREKKA